MSDDRTPLAKQLLAMMHSTMNLDLHELIEAGVIRPGPGLEGQAAWDKWNRDAPLFIVKLDAQKLNALAVLICYKFPDAFNSRYGESR